jgi:hypothetical protein
MIIHVILEFEGPVSIPSMFVWRRSASSKTFLIIAAVYDAYSAIAVGI